MKKVISVALLLILILYFNFGFFSFAENVDADSMRWIELDNGLEGGATNFIVINNQTFYAGTDNSGIFMTKDETSGWASINNGINDVEVTCIDFDKTNPENIYIGTDTGVYKSTDGGVNWSFIGLNQKHIYSLNVDKSNNDNIIVGSNGGIFRTNDGGKKWISLSKFHMVITLAVDPQTTQVIYAGTWGEGIFKSNDEGTTWNPTNNGLGSDVGVYDIKIDQSNSSIIYAATWSGIFKSTDGGNNWKIISKGFILSLLIDPANSSVIYAGSFGGFYVSKDSGEHWNQINTDFTINFIFKGLESESPIYIASDIGIFKSSNGGSTWESVNKGLNAFYIYCLSINPSNNAEIYLGSEKYIFKTDDGGLNWYSSCRTYKAYCLAINPFKNSVVYAGTYSGVFKSTDGGKTWNKFSNGLEIGEYYTEMYPQIMSLIIDKNNSQIIYAGTVSSSHSTNGGVYKSTDGGVNWQKTSCLNKNIKCLAMSPKDSSIVYAGSSGGSLFRTVDRGLSWNEIKIAKTGNVKEIRTIAIDFTDPDVILLGTFGSGIFKSTNGGTDWTPCNNGLEETDDFYVYSSVIDSTNSNHIYIATNSGIFESKDKGESWFKISGGAIPYSRFISQDPQNSSTIYATTRNGRFLKGLTNFSSPQNLQVVVSGASIQLSWSYPIQELGSIRGYAIYRGTTSGGEDATPLAKVDASMTTYTDINVTLGMDYYYYVKAYDNQDPANYSDPSNEVSAKIVDTTPPDVSISRPIDNATVESDSVFVAGKATDTQSEIDKVTVNGIEVSVSSDGSFSKTVNLTEGINRITVIAKDKAGNETKKTLTVTYKKPVQETVIILQIGNKNFTVNGASKELDSPPIIKNNRTLLPIRAVVESLGGTVGWDGTEKKVTISLGTTNIELWIGKNKARVNGVETPIDATNPKVVPEIINSRTMLPLRFVTENLGCTVEWDGTNKKITITYQP